MYSPGVTKAIAIYDAASNCLTSAYKQNTNNYLSLNCNETSSKYAVYHFQMQKIDHHPKYAMLFTFFAARNFRPQWLS